MRELGLLHVREVQWLAGPEEALVGPELILDQYLLSLAKNGIVRALHVMSELNEAIRKHVVQELLQGLVLLARIRVVADTRRDLYDLATWVKLVDADLRGPLGLPQLLDIAMTLRNALLHISLVARSRLHEG